MPDQNKLRKSLRCPRCHSILAEINKDSHLLCENCTVKFQLKNNVPILVFPKMESELQSTITDWHTNEIIPQFLPYRIVQCLKSPAPFKWFGKDKVLGDIFSQLESDGLYIDIGGGDKRLHDNIYNTNIDYDDDTDLVCDGHFLPFDDNSVDGIFILLVLEHVSDPFGIANEIHRVLKKGGFVFATLPFMQVLHENPKDYYRFTPDGIRKLFSRFGEVKLEVASGPTGSLIWIIKEYLAILCPFSNNKYVYASVREILGWILYPLIILDLYLNKKIRANKMASFFYFHGLKK